jgi:hypothetical protein
MAITQTVFINATLAWRAKQSTTSRRWIGICDALNLAMEADSLDELHGLIPESIHLLMIDLLQDNELDAFLRARGWQASNLPDPTEDDVQFEVPWELIAEGVRGGGERRAH